MMRNMIEKLALFSTLYHIDSTYSILVGVGTFRINLAIEHCKDQFPACQSKLRAGGSIIQNASDA